MSIKYARTLLGMTQGRIDRPRYTEHNAARKLHDNGLHHELARLIRAGRISTKRGTKS